METQRTYLLQYQMDMRLNYCPGKNAVTQKKANQNGKKIWNCVDHWLKYLMKMIPFPTELHHQPGITLYRCSHGCRFSVVADLFSVSIALVEKLYVPVCRELIQNLFRGYVKLPSADKNGDRKPLVWFELWFPTCCSLGLFPCVFWDKPE